ncbi:hypothetical protein B0H13DRAFT_2023344, partial [Mycena leptocephala]
MSFASLTNIYCLVGALSALQSASGLAAIFLHGLSGSAPSIILQVSPAVYGVTTASLMYRMLSYRRTADANALSRVNIQYYILIYTAGMWILCAVAVHIILPSQNNSMGTSCCVANAFIAIRCIPIAINVFLPYAIIASMFSAARTLRLRAQAVCSTRLVPIPSATDPGPQLPAWMLLHLADLREGKTNSVKTGSPYL